MKGEKNWLSNQPTIVIKPDALAFLSGQKRKMPFHIQWLKIIELRALVRKYILFFNKFCLFCR